MNFKFHKLEGVGALSTERVVLRATKDADIGRYVLFRAAIRSDDEVEGGNVPNAFWFPDKNIKKGDFVVLYSKSGTQSEKLDSKGERTSHFFYWNLKSTIWDDAHRAVVLEIGDWDFAPNP